METLIGFKIIGFVLRFIIVPYNQPYFVQENSVLLSWVVGDGAFWFYVPCCLLSVYIMYYIYILYSKRLETSWNRISAFGIYKSYTLKHLKKTIMSENPIILMNPWMYCPFIKVVVKKTETAEKSHIFPAELPNNSWHLGEPDSPPPPRSTWWFDRPPDQKYKTGANNDGPILDQKR